MMTVEADRDAVERRLLAGDLVCSRCGGVLAPWGSARPRRLRGLQVDLAFRPRRGLCSGCGATHVLLQVDALVRRADTVAVIGAALVAKAAGRGHRRIAEQLQRAPSTVRGWLRRLGSRAEQVRAAFAALAATVSTEAPLPAVTAGGAVAAAVEAIGAAAAAVAHRFGVRIVSGWRLACAATSGLLLAPTWPTESINTNWPWAALL